MNRRWALAFAVVALFAGCGDSGTASALPVAGVNEILGPYQAEPFRAFDEAMLRTAEDACHLSTGGERLELVLAEARGGGRIMLFYEGPQGAAAECLATIDAGGNAFIESSGTWNEGNADLPGALDVRPGSSGSSSGASAWSFLNGRAGSDIHRVLIELPSGDRITASLSGGRFAAWWPGDQMSARVLGFDAAGNEVYNEPF